LLKSSTFVAYLSRSHHAWSVITAHSLTYHHISSATECEECEVLTATTSGLRQFRPTAHRPCTLVGYGSWNRL